MDFVKNLPYKVEYITGGSFEQPDGQPKVHEIASTYYQFYFFSPYYTHMSTSVCCSPDEEAHECHYSFFLVTKQQ